MGWLEMLWTENHPVSKEGSSNNANAGLAVGPGGPGRECYPQGSGAPHDKWKGGALVLLSTGLGSSLQNPRSGETCRSGGGLSDGPVPDGPIGRADLVLLVDNGHL